MKFCKAREFCVLKFKLGSLIFTAVEFPPSWVFCENLILFTSFNTMLYPNVNLKENLSLGNNQNSILGLMLNTVCVKKHL
jgi:hypothetical protein